MSAAILRLPSSVRVRGLASVSGLSPRKTRLSKGTHSRVTALLVGVPPVLSLSSNLFFSPKSTNTPANIGLILKFVTFRGGVLV